MEYTVKLLPVQKNLLNSTKAIAGIYSARRRWENLYFKLVNC